LVTSAGWPDGRVPAAGLPVPSLISGGDAESGSPAPVQAARERELSPAVLATPSFKAANEAYMQDVTARLPGAQAELLEQLKIYFQSQERSKSVPS